MTPYRDSGGSEPAKRGKATRSRTSAPAAASAETSAAASAETSARAAAQTPAPPVDASSAGSRTHTNPSAPATTPVSDKEPAPAKAPAPANGSVKTPKRAAGNGSVPGPAPEPAMGNGSASGPEPAVGNGSASGRARKPGRTTKRAKAPAPAEEPGAADGTTLAPEPAKAGADVWDQRVAGLLSAVRQRLTGDYEVDEFGFDRQLTESVFLPLLRPLYRRWFRVETIGAQHLPTHGPALVVANHSGTVGLDALMLSVAVHDEHLSHRHLRLLGADFVFRMPGLSELARKYGSTLACNPDAERLLRGGELIGVFPEGFKGIGKAFAERYKLQRFGRGGFVSAALRTGTPIIPVSIVGAEEIYPLIGNIRPVARLLGLPYFPVTPTFPWLGPLGLIPLPSKWLIEFGEPIPTADLMDSADDPMVVFNLADQVRETIQQTLYRLLERRPDAFS